eukprot:CAMPEP_0181097804 /NCGR_PEP_ID=MMETSP1071-20121207/11765_1 /TAXON_ID=35127 /ORGANISM="Thalassiosira sp., Strain NH16" /LENGTH=438 /DNA_ID=CAMNT_0023180311 /DNA_START=139 /DNA_END=1455 /DNA_ORIENTATION=+
MLELDLSPWAEADEESSSQLSTANVNGRGLESISVVGYDYTGFLIFIKVLGLFSMTASGFLMRDVYLKLRSVSSSMAGGVRNWNNWRSKVSLTQCILFCLSVGDFFSAFFVQFLSTWMVPKSVPVSLSAGSATSCSIQGLLGGFFYALSAFSNATLAIAYCLIVKFGWKDEDKDRMRLPFTVVPIFCSVVLSIAPLPGKHYNYNGIFFCDITSSPLGCDREGSTTQCTADSIDMLLWVGIVPFMVAFVIIVCAMVVLAYSVLKQERTMDRYRREGEGVNRNMTTQTSLQGMCYIAAFGVCWIPWCIYGMIEINHGHIPIALAYIHNLTMPLQGFFNSLVYFRPRYTSRRASNPGESRTSSVLSVLKVVLPAMHCHCCRKDEQEPGVTNDINCAQNNANENIQEQKNEHELIENVNVEANTEAATGDKFEASVHFSDAA